MSIRQVVLAQLKATVETFTPLPFPEDVEERWLLQDFMLDSVAFTSLLTRLEGELGFIPLGILAGIAFPETVGDLIDAYANEAESMKP